MSQRLEQDVRQLLARRAEDAVVPPGLAGRAVAGARRRRRTVQSAGVAAVVAVLVVGTGLLVSDPAGRAEVAAPAAEPLPDVPVVPLYAATTGELRDWVDGDPRTRDVPGVVPVAAVPGGVLLLTRSATTLVLLAEDAVDVGDAVTLADELAAPSVAVSSDGGRVVVVVGGSGPPGLREIEVASGDVLRSLPLVGPSPGSVRPVAYSGGAVLLETAEPSGGQALLWEEGDDGVLGTLDGIRGVLGGADADLGSRAVGGRAAFEVAGGDCPVEVRELRDGDGSPWSLCGEDFLGFSPDGRLVLSGGGPDELVVREADGGAEVQRLRPTGDVGGVVWESPGSTVLTTKDGARTAVVRCVVAPGRCTELVSLDGGGPWRALAPTGAGGATGGT